ncbi:hybrid sensor histidine kinase/response regulator [Paucibacter sp. KCTC 42545]|uniref:hybrid sensor histidine kinase/response regulator n=1 Tax=Paucibacter sp. KCTC 42545 TaxID=1768242 RepID=UPI000733AC7D|nr:hybrid sensor histidine kinase/response regulator [Paucibacter sp. KCTC 42545]ALT79353.1 hypothetical protein AT984_21305 [Paucibacter sp. KCTC 42545]
MNSNRSQEQLAVDEELLRFLARQGRRMPVPVGLSAVLLGAIAAYGNSSVTQALSAAWVLAVLAVLALRWYVLGLLPDLHQLSVRKRLSWVTGLSGLCGLLFCLTLLFTPWMSDYERMVQTILLLGLCAGAVASTAGYWPVLLVFMLPLSLLNSLAWFFHSASHQLWWMDWALGVLILGFAGVLAVMARDGHRVFVDSVMIRLAQAKSNQQLSLALQQAQAAMQSRTRFLASASHDLRQPMHTLSLFGSALVRRPLDAATSSIASQMNQAVQSLTAQMDALLDISKLDAQVVPVNSQCVSLAQTLQRLCQEMRTAAAAKGLALGLNCPPDAYVDTDPVLLERVLRNLIDNAIKYTEQGHVDVNVVQAGSGESGLWRIDVCDTGVGIALPEQSQVFEEFYQVGNPERDRAKGLGLGLSIVSRLVDLLDLHLDLSSQPGEGSCFSLSVAVASSALPSAALGGEAGAASALAQLPHVHVLVLEAEAPVRQAMQALLNSHGAEVSLASTAREAVLTSLQRRPDIVLTDLRLQGGEEGLQALRSLRSALPQLPAILITGDTCPERLREAHDAGLLVLHKPVLEAQLLSAIKSALAMPVEAAPAAVSA